MPPQIIAFREKQASADSRTASIARTWRRWVRRPSFHFCELTLSAIIILLVAVLHVRFVSNVGGLWRDEVNSVNFANLPSFAEMRRLAEFDSFPLLFPLVVRGWTTILGEDNDAALRVLGLLTGLGILGALWANGRAFGIRSPVLSLALVGLNPMVIRYGDSTRAYGLGILLIILTLRSFWRLVEIPTPGTRRILVATVMALLSVQCLYYNSVLLLAIAAGASAVAVEKREWRTVGIVLAIGLLSAISLLPYVPAMQRMQEWNFLVRHSINFTWLWQRLCDVLGAPSPLGTWVWLALLLVSLALVARACFLRSARLAGAVLFAAVTLVVGVIVYAAFLRALSYATEPWYYLTLVVLAGCLLEVIISTGPQEATTRQLLRIGCLVLPAILLSVMFFLDWKILPVRLTNADLIGESLRDLGREGDLVIVPSWAHAIPLSRYYHGPAALVTLPPLADHRMHRYDLILQAMAAPEDPLGPVLSRIEKVLRSGRRIFLAGQISFPSAKSVPPSIVPPAYRDAMGRWRGQDPQLSWQNRTGYFLRQHARRAVELKVSLPGDGSILDYENIELGLIEGWRDQPDDSLAD